MLKKIIFHHPLPLNFDAPSGSGIRPVKMYQAFLSMGYSVDLVVGYSKDRHDAIRKVISKIEAGEKYDFCYSEASTMPLSLTDKDHIPRKPLIDAGFFRYLKRNKIKCGVFYRDVYWKFERSPSGLTKQCFKKLVARFFYSLELIIYKLYVDRVFVPSLGMGQYIPYVQRHKIIELNPGAISTSCPIKKLGENLELVYVGGTTGYYNINLLIQVVGEYFKDRINLTVCTRTDDAHILRDAIKSIPINVTIVSRSGEELEELYKTADCACLYMEPTEYRKFAVPIKLFEYVSYGKPVIASSDTWVGEFVNNQGLGWEVKYSEKALKDFFTKLLEDRSLIPILSQSVKEKSHQYSWQKRCEEVGVSLNRCS